MYETTLTSLALPTYTELQRKTQDLTIQNEALAVRNEALLLKNRNLEKILAKFRVLLDEKSLDTDCRGGCRAFVLKRQLLESKDMIKVVLHQYEIFYNTIDKGLRTDLNGNLQTKQKALDQKEEEKQTIRNEFITKEIAEKKRQEKRSVKRRQNRLKKS